MVPSDLSEPPRSEASKVRWFTEGETRWRTGAAIAWVMIILPCTLLISSAAASINLFHPVNWISECLSLVLSFSFWASVCFYCTVSVAVLLSYAKFNTGLISAALSCPVYVPSLEEMAVSLVEECGLLSRTAAVRDVIHQTQVAAILFPLHPARMFHILLFTICGSLSAWCFLGIIGGEEDYLTRLCETSEEFCLNEHRVFGILFGAWLGFYSSLKYFLKKEFHFAFPRVQQKRFFLIKMSLGSCMKQSIVQCIKACGWYYILYYLFGNIPRDALANLLGAPLDRSITQLNTIFGLTNVSQFWLLLTKGSLILFVWTFGKGLLVIFHTQLYTFPVESSFSHQQDQSLCVVLKNKTVPLLKYLAMFDLCHLSQFSSTRRKQIFSLSQPSGRPDNWTVVSTECLSLIESLTTKLSAEVSLQAHLQQPPLDPIFLSPALTNGHANGLSNGQANGHANGHAGTSPPVLSSPHQSPSSVSSLTRRQQSLSSPGAVHLWSEKTDNAQNMPSPLKPRQDNSLISRVRNKTIDKVDDLTWRVNQVPHNIARRLKQRPIIGFLFDEIPEARTQAIFSDCQLHIWAVEVLSRLVAWSYTEDTFGVVQKSLPKIFVSLLNLLQALDQHSKLSLALISKPEIQPRPRQPQGYQLRTTLVSSIYRITNIFHEHLRSIPMAVEHEKKLESFLKFRE